MRIIILLDAELKHVNYIKVQQEEVAGQLYHPRAQAILILLTQIEA